MSIHKKSASIHKQSASIHKQSASLHKQSAGFAMVLFLLTHTFAFAQVTTNSLPEVAVPQHVLVEGQVFNHSGGGIEGATVTLTTVRDQKVVAETTTTGYGDFKLTAANPTAGKAVLKINCTHYVSKSIDVTLTGDDDPPFVDHEMLGAIVLEGTVLDKQTQQPLPKAQILAKSGYKDYNAESAADGTFKIEGILPGWLSVKVTAEGFADYEAQIKESQNAEVQKILLAPERIVVLTVVGDDDKPIGGAMIEVIDSPHRKYRQAVTDGKGTAKLRGLDFDSDSLAIRLTHETRVSDVEFDRTIELPKDKPESQHQLVMAAAAAIVGTVRTTSADNRSDEGVPANGARISIGNTHQDNSPKAWSDFEGLYEIGGVPGGEAVVTVHLAGHAPEMRIVTTVPNEKTTVDFKLQPARSVTGVVRDPDGKAVPGTHINTTNWRGRASLGLAAMTDANGAFEFLDAPTDSFAVSVYAQGFKPLLDQNISAEQSAYTFKLEVDPRAGEPGMSASVKTGEPAPGFSVTTLDGKKLELSKLSGKVVVLDFWATWCGPCIGEIPGMVALHKTYGSRDDFVVISVSLDSDETALRTFVKERKMKWHHVWGESGNANAAADAYGVVAIPSMMVIDGEGKLVASESSVSAIKSVVEKLLDSNG